MFLGLFEFFLFDPDFGSPIVLTSDHSIDLIFAKPKADYFNCDVVLFQTGISIIGHNDLRVVSVLGHFCLTFCYGALTLLYYICLHLQNNALNTMHRMPVKSGGRNVRTLVGYDIYSDKIRQTSYFF